MFRKRSRRYNDMDFYRCASINTTQQLFFKVFGFHKSEELPDLPHTGSTGRGQEDITIRTFLCFLCAPIDAIQKLFFKVFGFHKSEELPDLPHTGSCGREGKS